MDEGGGAFYGPKIDIKIQDALGRRWQCSTVQLDFNLPERFGLTYTSAAGDKLRPIMIHRALLGSLERFMGILIEHYAGAFPLWLAPEQVRLLPTSDAVQPYMAQVAQALRAKGIRVTTGAGASPGGGVQLQPWWLGVESASQEVWPLHRCTWHRNPSGSPALSRRPLVSCLPTSLSPPPPFLRAQSRRPQA